MLSRLEHPSGSEAKPLVHATHQGLLTAFAFLRPGQTGTSLRSGQVLRIWNMLWGRQLLTGSWAPSRKKSRARCLKLFCNPVRSLGCGQPGVHGSDPVGPQETGAISHGILREIYQQRRSRRVAPRSLAVKPSGDQQRCPDHQRSWPLSGRPPGSAPHGSSTSLEGEATAETAEIRCGGV